MPIRRPGERFRYHRILNRKKGKRSLTAILSLTAMVDMFTVLAIFLLQNYNVKDFIVYTPKEVILPKAQSTKELKPAFVITISKKEILLDKVFFLEAIFWQRYASLHP
jgi:biopolymer transport protein ExbD